MAYAPFSFFKINLFYIINWNGNNVTCGHWLGWKARFACNQKVPSSNPGECISIFLDLQAISTFWAFHTWIPQGPEQNMLFTPLLPELLGSTPPLQNFWPGLPYGLPKSQNLIIILSFKIIWLLFKLKHLNSSNQIKIHTKIN